MKALRFVITAAAALCGAVLSCWVLARWSPLAGTNPVELLSNLMPGPLLLAPVAALALAFLRPRLALLAVLPVLHFLYAFGPLFVPKTPATAQRGRALTVTTFNLYGRSAGFEPVIEVIEGIDADIIALQELGVDATAAFETRFAARYPYRALHPQRINDIAGQGVMSKFPIRSTDFWLLRLGNQRVTIDIDGAMLTLFNIHAPVPFLAGGGQLPRFTTAARNGEIADHLRRIARESGPVLLVGDFNMADQSVMHKAITRQLGDSWREVGWGFGPTWPALRDLPTINLDFPSNLTPGRIVRIDYVFHSAGIQPQSIAVWHTGAGSDHRPVYGTFVLE